MASKPGYKTSEFWLSLAAMIVGVLIASGAFSVDGTVAKLLGFLGTVLAGLGYTYSRTVAKVKDPAALPAKTKP